VMADTQLQAATDSLTGLLNRRSFERKLTAIRSGEPTVALAMADLDHFKKLNDTYGHETGDRALRLFADVLRGSFREHDLLGRQGGEEFVIALPACTAEGARRALDAVRERLDAALTVAGLPKFTVSIGVIDATVAEELPDLTARADAAMFAAKRAGRDQVVVQGFDGRTPTPATGSAPPSLAKEPR
jgi:diguanylate cyclase (GGDEF)-like protein